MKFLYNFMRSAAAALFGLIASAGLSAHSVQGHEVKNIYMGIPICTCVDGTVIIDADKKEKEKENNIDADKIDLTLNCIDHGGDASISDLDLVLTIDCNTQKCKNGGNYIHGIPDPPDIINEKNAGLAHTAFVHYIVSRHPKNEAEFKEIAMDLMQKRAWPKWKITITINILFFEISFEFGGGGGGGGRRLEMVDTDENRNLRALPGGKQEEISRLLRISDTQSQAFFEGILDLYRCEARTAWEIVDSPGRVAPGGCILYPEWFEKMRGILGLLAMNDDDGPNQDMVASMVARSFISGSANECSQDKLDAYVNFAKSAKAFWSVHEEQYIGEIREGPLRRSSWPWVTDVVNFGCALLDPDNSFGDAVLIGAIASAKKFFLG